eukprot:Phypoly_transcript_00221.p1 GENE.Phypoly_transcript_00221~~Phypoly_transcript_00221.p1  ORF type:complete len:1296 (+),score=249.38 Phypoly_transcript_00221:1961-5848(+)
MQEKVNTGKEAMSDWDFPRCDLATMQEKLVLLLDFEQKIRLLLEKLKQERENDFDNLNAHTKQIVALAARKWMGKVMRTRLEKQITALILPINEANAIAHALNKNITFELQLYASSFSGVKHPLSLLGGTTDTSIAVSVTTQEGASHTHTLCTPTHFLERLSGFRDLYNSSELGTENVCDPFSKLPQLPILQGVSRLYLQPLLYLLPQKHELPVVGPDGGQRGHMTVSLTPTKSDVAQKQPTVGAPMTVALALDSLVIDSCQEVYVRFNFFDQIFETPPTYHPQCLKYTTTIHVPFVESTLLEYLQNEAITFEVYGTIVAPEPLLKKVYVGFSPAKKTQMASIKKSEITPKPHRASSFDFLATLDIEEFIPHSHTFKSVPIVETCGLATGDASGIVFRLRKDRPSKRIIFKIVKGTPVHSFKSMRIYNQRVDGFDVISSRQAEWVTLPVISASEDTLICDWEVSPQTRMFNYKTRKGEKIIFTVGIEINLDGTKFALVSKDVTAKISAGGHDELSVESTLEELIDNPAISRGLPVRVKIQRSRKLERQSSIEAMIDQHREGLAKLDNALQVEKMRQEKDLKEFICSKSPPQHPDLDVTSNTTSTRLPRPVFQSGDAPPKVDSEPPISRDKLLKVESGLPIPRESTPPNLTRPRSYSAAPLSPPTFLSPPSTSPTSASTFSTSPTFSTSSRATSPTFSTSPCSTSPPPTKSPRDFISPTAQLQNAKREAVRKQVHESPLEVSISDISPSDLQESDMEGWLSKKSTKQDTWQKKWFTYQKPFLSFCSSNSTKRVINISTATIATLPNLEHSFAIITRGRVWVLRAENEESAKEWIYALDPARMVEESLTQLRREYDLLRTEMEQKDETIADLSASLDRGHEMASKMADMQNELDLLRVELSSKNNVVSDLVASLVVLNEKVAKEALGQRKELEQASCENYKLQNTITSLQNAHRSANDELTRLRADLQNKDNKLQEISELCSSPFVKLEKLSLDVQERTTKVLSLFNPLTITPQLAQTVANHFQAVHAQIEALRSDLETKDQPHEKAMNNLRNVTTICNTKKQDSEEVALLSQLEAARQNASYLHGQLLEANSLLDASQCQLQSATDEIKLKDARLQILEKHLVKLREEFSFLQNTYDNMLGVSVTGCTLCKNPPLQMFREANAAHQSHNTYLSMEVQRIEEEARSQALVYQETIQRLKDELFRKRQHYNLLLMQNIQPDTYKMIQDLNYQVEDLKQKYFISLSIGGKLQQCLAGIVCNVDAFDLLERANQEHITDLEQWPTWISNQLSRDSKPLFV